LHPWRSTLAGCCVVAADFIHGWRWGRTRLGGGDTRSCGNPAPFVEPPLKSSVHNATERERVPFIKKITPRAPTKPNTRKPARLAVL
jgi:hypothetical protein